MSEPAPHSSNRPGPLAGVRVLDVTHVMAGAWCGSLLAQMGADVVKVERLSPGEDLRRGQQSSGGAFRPFDAVNHGKRSLAVDLDDDRGVAVVCRLAESAGILVQNMRPGALERRGLGYDALSAANPGLVYASISAFGGTGPYRDRAGFDLIAQAMSGIMSVTGERGQPPVAAGVPLADIGAGSLAALGILSAWIERMRTGRGQQVETSLFEAALSFTIWESALFLDTGRVPRPNGARHRLASPYGCFASADGWLIVAAGTQANWQRLCRALDRPDLLADERFAQSLGRLANRAALEEELGRIFAGASSEAWMAKLEAAGVPCAPVLDMEAVWSDPQIRARGMLAESEPDAEGRRARVIGSPVKLSATPWRPGPEPAALGEHSRVLLEEAGMAGHEIDELIAAGVVEQAGEEA